MGLRRWIFGTLGWVIFGPIGGLIGFLIGAASEDTKISVDSGSGGFGGTGGGAGGYSGSGSGAGGSYGTGSYTRGTSTSQSERQTGQRNSFLICLMVLSAAVIKADGKVTDAERQFVRNFIRNNFGDQAATEADQILEKLLSQDINIYQVGAQIRTNMNYSQRLQLFHYLVNLAQCDGITDNEISTLESVAAAIGLQQSDIESILAMFRGNSAEDAYKVLEISPSATDEEVRKAYKRMALKYHPDKVATLGEDVQKAAEEKFKAVQAAYETIKKERGL